MILDFESKGLDVSTVAPSVSTHYTISQLLVQLDDAICLEIRRLAKQKSGLRSPENAKLLMFQSGSFHHLSQNPMPTKKVDLPPSQSAATEFARR